MVMMVDDHISMSMPEINNEDYYPPITELEGDEYKQGTGYDEPNEYLSYD